MANFIVEELEDVDEMAEITSRRTEKMSRHWVALPMKKKFSSMLFICKGRGRSIKASTHTSEFSVSFKNW